MNVSQSLDTEVNSRTAARALVPDGWMASTLAVGSNALAAALATAGMALPRGTLAGAGLSVLAFFFPALILCASWRVALRALRRLDDERSRGLDGHLRAGFVGLASFGMVSWLANLLLVEAAMQSGPLIAYAASVAVAAVVTWQCRRNDRLKRLVSAVPLASMALMTAVGLGLLDAHFYPHAFTRLHVGLLVLTLALFSLSTTVLTTASRPRQVATWISALAALVLVGIFARSDRPRTYRAMLKSVTSQQHVLMALRGVTDGDGDRFSPSLGGGDCNDADEHSFPLASAGTDCLGWKGRSTTAQATWPAAQKVPGAPDVVLLLTIDAFRCGFGQSEPAPELLSACPELTALAKEGRLRRDAHTTAPRTDFAIGSLNTGAFRFDPAATNQFLAEWMAKAGYRTHAISTAGNQFPGQVRKTFQTTDVSLRSSRLSARAGAVTEKIMEVLGSQPTGNPLFLWAHYFDVHAPYVEEPGSAWAFSPDLERYTVEVRRTDAAIGRLARALRASPHAARLVVFITADHGEEFGEKGAKYHGFSLNEEAIRIPMLVWTPDAEMLKRTPTALPVSIAEVGGYLTAMVTGRPFETSDEAFFSSRSAANTSFGIYRDGWKLIRHRDFAFSELYHLTTDPLERADLAQRRPNTLNELGARLASYTAGWPADEPAEE